jgi:TRAP-type C4-dicarboxylate transport system permease small subunit
MKGKGEGVNVLVDLLPAEPRMFVFSLKYLLNIIYCCLLLLLICSVFVLDFVSWGKQSIPRREECC